MYYISGEHLGMCQWVAERIWKVGVKWAAVEQRAVDNRQDQGENSMG
jgi:hypothetical protein